MGPSSLCMHVWTLERPFVWLVLVTGREEKGQNRVIYCVCVFDGGKKGLGCPGFVSKSQIDGFPDGRRTREAGRRVDPGLAGVR